MQTGRECQPGQVIEVLGGAKYSVRLLDGTQVEVPPSTILKMKEVQVQPGQWVAVGYGQILYCWPEQSDLQHVDWAERIKEIPQSVFEARGSHDAQADHYEEMLQQDLDCYIRENYFQILDRVIEWADLTLGTVLLEIGIGTGLLTERIPKGVLTFGIDLSEKMMEKAKGKELPVKLTVGSFLDIPFPDQFFERIVSTFALHHLTPEEKRLAFQEMDRVLKPDGCWVIGDFMFENQEQQAGLVQRFTEEGRTDMLEEFEDEYFTEIDKSVAILKELGYEVEYEQGSTISWILKATKNIQ